MANEEELTEAAANWRTLLNGLVRRKFRALDSTLAIKET